MTWVYLSSPGKPLERKMKVESGKRSYYLQGWRVWDSSTAILTSVHMEGQSARFRLPYGYVFSNLVQDATVSVKALKHLYHMTVRGSYSDMPSPEAEGPKCMPYLTLAIASFCVEIADDPFEGRLNLAWRAGLEAAKIRVDREQAYEDKVATIINADVTQGGSPAELRAEYRFSSKHSVSIEDARQRLYKVHSIDWGLRLDHFQKDQIRNEEAVRHEFHPSFQSASRIRNIVDVSPDDPCTPLFRALIRNLSLSTAPPSFPADSLPEYLYEQEIMRLPLFDIPPHEDLDRTSWTFDTDLVIAEELAGGASVDWVLCPVSYAHDGIHGAAPLSISVPKTIMPVKICSWGMSYGPATQDLMKILDTITSTPRDSSPGLGFWDKLRLIFHWSVRASFKGEGFEIPTRYLGRAPVFALAWQGNVKLLIGRHNDDKELVQVISDSMMIVIPNFHRSDAGSLTFAPVSQPFKKICAKVLSGVRFGVGFVLERACGSECQHCNGSAFHRKCRFFDFKPHYKVKLEKKNATPEIKGPDDSYKGFRSDFIHLGLYLTPKVFAHFWSWWSLFDAVMSLPIRQGPYYPRRTISPKFGRHIATLKYRVSIRQLSIMHGYIDNGRETWADGVTPWVGVKGKIDEFQVDMHQRDQETVVPGLGPHSTKVLRRKPFYAAEVVLKGLDLRAILAIFADPKKQLIPVNAPQNGSNYRTRNNYPTTPMPSVWYDPDDFVETDWSSSLDPTFHVLPVVACSHFMFFKRNDALVENPSETSKFGNEDSHVCLLGKEPSVPEVQVALTSSRIEELKCLDTSPGKKVVLLEKYISSLHEPHINLDGNDASSHYQMPSDSVSPDEWAEFDNVYQIHCPKIFMDAAVRDDWNTIWLLVPVKFVRDQANDVAEITASEQLLNHLRRTAAHAAASALKAHVRSRRF
ncbi:RNA pol II promoter Fmp27 protein domain-containing protein [Desarmillaria tabescens]|uniref:RNA pol II promoter Fmp27 protein domain-containing protein n=1 Tax=Armillaria tabescens TaxID=1929756 RepID=A0AA39NM74_ARMTA|nr:RNA pol II promoter Fmp27 protein domain-containing protein [Desarmillaria tabescens]KAK0468226.1 RNA pol II promoter Fmp27 protein domain-containing protein [Desarmillaria tabescens]